MTIWRLEVIIIAPSISQTQEGKGNDVDSIYSIDDSGKLSMAIVALIQHCFRCCKEHLVIFTFATSPSGDACPRI